MSLSISLVETFLTEDGLNSMISTCKDLDSLDEMLDIKLELVKKEAHQKAVLPLHNVLNNINNENLNKACSVLEKLLVLQSDDTGITHLQSHINTYVSEIKTNGKEALNIAINLIISLLKVYCGTSKLNLSLEKLFEELITSEDPTKDVNLLNTFVTSILPKYTQNCSNKYLFEIVNITVKTERLDILSSFIKLFLREDLKYHIELLINNLDFWELVCSALFSPENFLKKQAIYILKSVTDFSLNSSTLYDASEFIKLSSVTLEKTKETWKTYFLLLNSAQENEICAIEAHLGHLPALTCLHTFWVICMYNILFLHPEADVVLTAVCSILTSAWFKNVHTFTSFSEYLVSAFARISYTKFCSKICPLITNFIQNSDEEIFVDLLKTNCDKGVLSPFLTWAFFNSVFCDRINFKIPLDLIITILHHIHKLPNANVRCGCVVVFAKYFDNENVIKHYTFDDLLDIHNVIDALYSYMDPEILPYFKPAVLLHQDEILNQVQSWQNLKQMLAREVKSVISWSEMVPIEVDYPAEEIINACSSMECVDVTDQMCVLKKVCTDDQILEYLARRLDNIDDSTNSKNLKKVAQHICKVFKNNELLKEKLGEKVNDILLACDNENMEEVAVALEIVIKADADVFNEKDILSIWLEKDIACVTSVDEDVRVQILYLYEKTVKRNPSEKINQEVLKIIECTSKNRSFYLFHMFLIYILPNIVSINTSFDSVSITRKIVEEIRKNIRKFTNYRLLELLRTVSVYLQTVINTLVKKGPESATAILKIMEEFSSLSDRLSFIDSLLIKQFYNINNISYLAPKLGIFMDILIQLLSRNTHLPTDLKIQHKVNREINAVFAIINISDDECFEDPKIEIILTILKILNYQDKALTNDVADHATALLIKSYSVHFNEEYLPDSLLHERKLTIAQTLLVIQPFMKKTTEIIDLMIKSLCNENHQTDVRQTMQWLLIRLLADNENCLAIIKSTLSPAITASAVTNLIPVMHHLILILKMDNDNCTASINLLLSYTMSKHSELRVYAQTAVFRLYEYAKQRRNEKFLEKYYMMCTVVERALRTAGDRVDKTLQEDRKLFYDFDPFDDYCMEEVFPGIHKNYCVEFKSIPGKRKKPRNAAAATKTTTHEAEKPENPQKESLTEKDKRFEMTGNLILVATFVKKLADLGALSRTCRAFGVKQLIVGDDRVCEDEELKQSEKWLDVFDVKETNLPTWLKAAKNKGYAVVAAKQAAGNVGFNAYKFPKKTVIVLGNEEAIPPSLLPYMDDCIELPQVGVVQSRNAYIAATTLIWEYAKQHAV